MVVRSSANKTLMRFFFCCSAIVAGCSSSSFAVPADDAAPSDGIASDAAIDTAPALAARLSTSGEQILDPDGKPIVLRGWNWGEWKAWQLGKGGDAEQNEIQGANAVRIPLRWWGDYPNGANARDDSEDHIDQAHFDDLDAAVKDAVAHHLWVILFIDSNCGQASTVRDTIEACGTGSDGNPASFMNDEASKAAFFAAWKAVAAHFANTPYIGMYELLPEPNFGCKAGGGCPDWSLSKTFYQSLIPVVRAADPRTPILVGPNGAYRIEQMETSYMPGVDNVVYTGDLLEHASSNAASVGFATAFRAAHHVPVFIQQFGVPKSNPDAKTIVTSVAKQLSDASVGFTWWTYREPRSPGGKGFAPYYGQPYQEDAGWLAFITGFFR